MGHVFVSYSRRDRQTVDQIVEKLEGAGLEIWIDRQDIRAGKQWRLEIVKAIDTAESFILHLSESAAASDNVRKELDLAEDAADPFVLPVLLQEVQIPPEMRYQLAGTQHIPYYLDPEGGYQELEGTLLNRHQEIAGGVEEGIDHREVELVIKGVDLAAFDSGKQAELLAFLSQLTGADPDDLAITRMEAGSLHVFVEIPADPAYELKAQALNGDARLRQAGIEALRFVGDRRLIPVPGAPPLISQVLGAGGPGLVMLSLVVVLIITTLAYLFFRPDDPGRPPTMTDSPRPSLTSTQILSPMPTLTASRTGTATPRSTSTPTASPTSTATATSSAITKQTPTLTPSEVPQRVLPASATPTNIPRPPTHTPTPVTPTRTATPTDRPTDTPTVTLTTPPPMAFIAGVLWNDADNNATLDTSETTFQNVTVILKSGDCSGAVVSTARTNPGGGFGFADLTPGDYCVVVDVNSMPSPTYGWMCTTQNTNQVSFSLKGNEKRNLPFGFYDTMQ